MFDKTNRRDPSGFHLDLYTRAILTIIAISLGVLVLRPALSPVSVKAQSETPALYIEPGTTSIRNPDGSAQGAGKVVIDLRTGDIWGFPTISPLSVYPIDGSTTKPPTIKPIYLGRFDFSAIRRTP